MNKSCRVNNMDTYKGVTTTPLRVIRGTVEYNFQSILTVLVLLFNNYL